MSNLRHIAKAVRIASGQVLRELRHERHISQDTLAALMDCDRTYPSLLERGLRQPTLGMIFLFAKTLDVDPRDLIGRIAEHGDEEVKSAKPLLAFDPAEVPRPAVQPEIASVADAERKRFERISRIVLKVARSDMDVSQQELAKRLSWTRNQVANLETGRRGIGIADFIMIAKALRLDPCRLLNGVLRW